MRSTAVSLAVVAALAFMGCAPTEEPAMTAEVETLTEPMAEEVSSEGDGSLVAAALVGAWKLESLSGGPVAEDVVTTIEFSEDGRLGGNAGCNNYMGEYTFDEGVLAFPMAIAATKKMCPGPMMEQEDAFLKALSDFNHAAIDGDELKLFVADTDEPLIFSRIALEIAER